METKNKIINSTRKCKLCQYTFDPYSWNHKICFRCIEEYKKDRQKEYDENKREVVGYKYTWKNYKPNEISRSQAIRRKNER